ncbi:MAG TPA: copper homeostasis protein CutC, partial [Flavobacterium sp.]
MKIEIACFNLESALIADRVGADRIELCKKYSEGGTTPNLKMAIEARSKIKAPLFVMIRPRGGNFTYSEDEFTEMKISITELKNSVDGFVFGILNEDLTINILQNTELVKLANPLPCTFHRAFDKVHDTSKSLEEIIECGFKTILTSGTMPNVMEGKTELRSLVEKAGSRITIMPGGG